MKRMNKTRRRKVLLLATTLLALPGLWSAGSGCAQKAPPYGVERQAAYLSPMKKREVWAVAPAVNLSGYRDADPLLQADIVFQQLQQVRGLTVIPVNRVVEVYATLKIDKVQSGEQAALVCDLLGCDGLLVPTVTAYDPYDPPKLGASLQLLTRPMTFTRPVNVDPRELARLATPRAVDPTPTAPRMDMVQAVGMFDAANGSVREALAGYVAGRHDPIGPMGPREYLVSMDRYSGFVYHELIGEVLNRAAARRRA
jgi:hypothetical protein